MKHIQAIHEGKKNFRCPVDNCPKNYVTAYPGDLKKHIKTHHKNYKD